MPILFGSVIVEPRRHPALQFVVQNVLDRTPINSNIIIIHGTENCSWARNLFKGPDNRICDRLSFQSCGKANLTAAQYNALLKSKTFWEAIPFSKILIFQTDSIIVNPNRESICDYFKFVYVGAPWTNGNVGNGGFSLRDKQFCLNAIRSLKMNNVNEDVWFSNFMRQSKQYTTTPFAVGQQFAVETVYHAQPFAIHNCWKYLNSVQMTALINAYPEIGELQKLQLNQPKKIMASRLTNVTTRRPAKTTTKRTTRTTAKPSRRSARTITMRPIRRTARTMTRRLS